MGDYRRGKRHGYGVYSFPNGDQYLGEYEDDIPQVRARRLGLAFGFAQHSTCTLST